MKNFKTYILTYKNYRIIVPVFYLICLCIIYFFWTTISSSWLNILSEILKFSGFKSIILLLYFILINVFLFSYVIFIPLIEFDKNYELDDHVQIIINSGKKLKEIFKGITLFLLFPIFIFLATGIFFMIKLLINVYLGVVAIFLLVLIPTYIIYIIIKKIFQQLIKKDSVHFKSRTK